MANTSATGGFLQLFPAEDPKRLEDLMHGLISGITGLPEDLVRPVGGLDPAVEPRPEVDWCLFGFTEARPVAVPEIVHHGEEQGYDELFDSEELFLCATFYGPGRMVNARLLRRALYVPQNRESLRPAGVAFSGTGSVLMSTEQAETGPRARAELLLTFRVRNRCTTAVLNLTGTEGLIQTDLHNKASVSCGV